MMAVTAPEVPIEELLQAARKKYKETFDILPTAAGIAPGRVNIIGEHTDYNEGFVFPMALPLYTVVVGGLSPDGDGKCRVLTTAEGADLPLLVEFNAPTPEAPLTRSDSPSWANYVKGVVANFHAPVPGFQAVVVSSVPLGGGLSSSAALEVSTYSFLEELLQSPAESKRSKALACQKAEHQFANMPCGIMDQFVSTMAEAGNILLIDCRDLSCELVPFAEESLRVVVCNSNVRHSLSGSEYPARRSDCFAAAAAIGRKSLREANLDDLQKHASSLSEVALRRARHVVGEIARTEGAVRALRDGDFGALGALMSASHRSLRDDYEVSCPELDSLVAAALEVEGVKGSRMTGGGFGGCTVTLAETGCVDKLMQHIVDKYTGRPTFYVAAPARGAYRLAL